MHMDSGHVGSVRIAMLQLENQAATLDRYAPAGFACEDLLYITLPETNSSHLKMVGRLVSFWETLFSGAMWILWMFVVVDVYS